MKLAGFLVCVTLVGLGIYLLRYCSSQFMLLRHAKPFRPYSYAIGGILSLVLITLAVVGAVLLFVSAMR